ncbi:plasmid mobilization relaxosome protein MobC [Enterococcus cecorum]|uniref:plasmid mobilization protein n=1 Tax=Enterococcus cecorum TaxID=44008 RepID=UPI000A694F51|nr:plasmid mobilization relaxosome protein MobC [Enterococcus cecorum]MCJ0535044.1 MobC family plasmid mobilization relaxosome protein [Enterococcus cecorum]MCJ0554849.1 MobC family plasmid mobilization relaxosome protein [Enterococcus cecorum]MCJ0591433.1 MobC family plasmid mobilization relaxosome protein [Enterococcus cecorum]CAI3329343.1 plasmid mobilization relaxosome protein MobC [Enterococcus cecorum]CAI3356879.1 plasmid mobilization relaxosome protein MobC [Enterococcus cecorum]
MKNIKRLRYIEKKVRLTKEEDEYIRKKVEQSPFNNFQNFARIMLITGEAKIVDYSELKKLNGQINRLGNNINQIVKLAHYFDEISNEDIQEIKQNVNYMKALVEAVLKEDKREERKNWQNGLHKTLPGAQDETFKSTK